MHMKTKRNHRKLFVLSAIMLIGFMNLSAQTLTKTFTFNFDTEDFRLEQIGSERKCEFDMGLDYIYGKLEEPALPHVPYDILLPDNYRVQSFTYSIGDDTCRFNQVLFYPTEEDFMENNPDTLTVDCIPLYPTPGVSSSSNPGSNPPYPLQTFPVKVSHDGNYDRDGYRLENFTICPFIYHAVEQKLVLATSIELTVSIAPYDDATPSHKGTDDKWLKSHIYNPEDFGMGTENWTPVSTGIAEECVTKTRVQTANSKLLCTAPDAVKMEVYTMDAVKVGEARFTHGQAEVKVSNTPATYLYIVTYPDGRRESGKVAVKGEG